MIAHLACIMDGNRRWATKQGKPPWVGHKAGATTIKRVVKLCLDQKIEHLSLYTFSLENFNRSEIERSYLFDIIMQQAEDFLLQFVEQGIKIKFIGNLSLFPNGVQKVCKRLQEKTINGTQLQLNFLFGYGGRQEIFAAAQLLAQDLVAGKSITQDVFESHLWTAGTPDPDLIIRTGGVERLSNFLLYQGAYSEIRFSKTFWPDLKEEEILEFIESSVKVQKNIGK